MSDRKSYDPNSHEGMQIRLNNYAEELEYERVTSRAAIATLTAENAELRRALLFLTGDTLDEAEGSTPAEKALAVCTKRQTVVISSLRAEVERLTRVIAEALQVLNAGHTATYDLVADLRAILQGEA